MQEKRGLETQEYLNLIGVPRMLPRTSPFDPGYDSVTFEGHLEQSSHLMAAMKLSMACWQIANAMATRKKVDACRRYGVPTCTGGGPFEVAGSFDTVPEYLDLCADIGMTRVEAGEGFIDLKLPPSQVVIMAEERGLEVQFELGKKHGGTFTADIIGDLIDQGQRWLDAGAKNIVIEARENARNIGVFGSGGEFDGNAADRFARAFGLEVAIFEAPTKPSQFALLNHFGPDVYLSNVRLEELLRVEIYRRGLHSDAFQQDNLRPKGPRR